MPCPATDLGMFAAQISSFSSYLTPLRALQWLNRFNPYTFILYAMAVDQLGNNEQRLITPDGRVTTVSEFMKDYFGYDYGFRWCAPLLECCACCQFCVLSWQHASRLPMLFLFLLCRYLRKVG